MKRKIILALLGVFLFAPVSAEGQILKKLKKKAERQVEKEVDKVFEEEKEEPKEQDYPQKLPHHPGQNRTSPRPIQVAGFPEPDPVVI